MSKNPGKQFEEDWKNSYVGMEYCYIRLQDSAKWLHGDGSSFTPNNMCDAIQFTRPYLWLLELKSTVGASMSFTPYLDGISAPWDKPKNDCTKVMIKHTQVKSLMKQVGKNGVLPGFIFNFRERVLKTKTVPNKVYFVHITDFNIFAKESGKSSISDEDCARVGIPISGILKKVHYKYDISKFIERAVIHYKLNKYIS